MEAKRFPLVEVSGTPYDMGYQHGSEFKALIVDSMKTFEGKLSVPKAKAVDYAAQSIPYCWERAPELMEEVQGIADGSGLSLEEIFVLNASLDIYGSSGRVKTFVAADCWTSAVNGKGAAEGKTFVTWTAEDSPSWLKSCVLIKVEPENGIPCLTWTFAGFVGRPGMNPYIGLSAGTLSSTDCDDGLPYPFVCRKVLSKKTVGDAVFAITTVKRMSGMDYTVGDTHGTIASIETSGRAHRVIHGTEGWIAYTGLTNDGGADKLKTHNVPPKGGKAELRLNRIGDILHENWGQNTLEDLERMQRDHGPGDLCAHGGSTLTAFICDIKASKMWVAYGSPCEHEYIEYTI